MIRLVSSAMEPTHITSVGFQGPKAIVILRALQITRSAGSKVQDLVLQSETVGETKASEKEGSKAVSLGYSAIIGPSLGAS